MTTREEIIAAAKEAGFVRTKMHPALERFYAIANEAGRQAEREEVAQAVEKDLYRGEHFASVIRARSTK